MAFLITNAGSSTVERKTTLGHKDYPPDKGNTSLHWRNCRLERAGSGPYGSRWSCERLDPSKIWVPKGHRAPYGPPSCSMYDTVTKKSWGGKLTEGHEGYCSYGKVAAVPTGSVFTAAKAACVALSEGQQLRDQPGGVYWRHKDLRRPAAGSASDRQMAYPAAPAKGDLRLQCYFKSPLPSKERPFQQREQERLIAAGYRFITEAEKEEYAPLCPPATSATGLEVTRKPVWKKTSDYFPANPLVSRTDVVDGAHELRCYPDVSDLKFTIDPTLSRLNQEEAFAIAAQATAEEEAEREEQRQEMEEYLQRGEEPDTPFFERYRIPLLLLGGMIVLGGGAALIQRTAANRRSMSSNPTFLFTVGINGAGRTLKIKAPTLDAAKKKYDRSYRSIYGPAYVRSAAPRERM